VLSTIRPDAEDGDLCYGMTSLDLTMTLPLIPFPNPGIPNTLSSNGDFNVRRVFHFNAQTGSSGGITVDHQQDVALEYSIASTSTQSLLRPLFYSP
jgi:hypothetical protein